MGTDPHSHPGITAPDRLAAVMASGVLRGRIRRTMAGVIHAAIAPLTGVPSTRNGIACTTTPTKIAAAVLARAFDITTSDTGTASSAVTRTMPTNTRVEADLARVSVAGFRRPDPPLCCGRRWSHPRPTADALARSADFAARVPQVSLC